MRDQEIRQQIQSETIIRLELAEKNKKETYEKNSGQYRQEFRQALCSALREYHEKHKPIKDSRMKYIYINCLRSSLEVESCEYLIQIMDESKYRDPMLVEHYYIPRYLKPLVDVDKEYFFRLIMSKVICAKKYEVKNFLRKYLWDTYLRPIPQEIKEVMQETDRLAEYEVIHKAEEVLAGYGEMLEEEDEIWNFTYSKE